MSDKNEDVNQDGVSSDETVTEGNIEPNEESIDKGSTPKEETSEAKVEETESDTVAVDPVKQKIRGRFTPKDRNTKQKKSKGWTPDDGTNLEKKAKRSGNPAIRAGSASKPSNEPISLDTSFLGRIKSGIKNRAHWPKKGVTLSDYEEVIGSKLRMWLTIVLTAMFLVVWGMMYFAASQSLGGIRLNNSLLEQDINAGHAFWVSGVSADGGIQLKNGTNYPAGSLKDTVLVSHYFDTPYYIPEDRVLAAPIDIVTFLKETVEVWVWFAITCVWFGLDKLGARRNSPKKYYEVVYDHYPRWFRYLRWGVVIIMVATSAFWFWPFI